MQQEKVLVNSVCRPLRAFKKHNDEEKFGSGKLCSIEPKLYFVKFHSLSELVDLESFRRLSMSEKLNHYQVELKRINAFRRILQT